MRKAECGFDASLHNDEHCSRLVVWKKRKHYLSASHAALAKIMRLSLGKSDDVADRFLLDRQQLPIYLFFNCLPEFFLHLIPWSVTVTAGRNPDSLR